MASPCRTLVVDDDEDMAMLVATTIELANHGLEVAGVACSGEDALEQLEYLAADVIVLDFRMPGRNGLETADEILRRSPNQPIVLFSAFLDEATLVAAERAGVRECVSKDRLRELPDIVRKYCPAA